MNQEILARLQKRITEVIAWNARQELSCSFMEIKSQVLFEFRGDVLDKRHEYSSELSRIFGKHRAAKHQKKLPEKRPVAV